LVYTWKWIRVLGTGLIQAGVVDTHPKFSIRFGDDDWVGQPYRMMNFFDEAGIQQFSDLLSDEVLSLNRLSARLLAYWLGVGVNLQAVLDHLPGDPRHLRRLPCEYVGICLEESDKREFLFLV
jgi:hypothetical protein